MPVFSVLHCRTRIRVWRMEEGTGWGFSTRASVEHDIHESGNADAVSAHPNREGLHPIVIGNYYNDIALSSRQWRSRVCAL